RAPQLIEVAHDVVRTEERTLRTDCGRTGANGGGSRRPEVGEAHLPLEFRTVERTRAGAALVDHHQAVLRRSRPEPPGDPGDRTDARLARPAAQDEQDALRRRPAHAHGNDQAELAAKAARVVERDGQPLAGVAG